MHTDRQTDILITVLCCVVGCGVTSMSVLLKVDGAKAEAA